MVWLRTAQADDVLEHAAAKLRSWQTANEDGPLEQHADPKPGRVTFELDRVLVLLSRAARWRGRIAAARWFAQRAYVANPHSADANLSLALALRRSGRDAEALPYLRHAAELDGKRKEGNWELARLLLRLQRGDTSPGIAAGRRAQLISALRAAVTSIDRRIRAESSIALSNLLHDLGEAAKAREAAEVAVELAAGNPRALRAKANALTALGNFAEARPLYEMLLAQEPRHRELTRKLEGVSLLFAPSDKMRESHGAPAAILVGVGGGLGDMLHATPMIRNLAQRTGSTVDVVVAADHPQAEFLFRNRAYVSAVWGLCPEVLERQYKTVLLTHSFANWRLPFRSERVLISATWRLFRAGHLNETIFNLEAAQALLGIRYQREDAVRYFAGELAWAPPAAPLVGLHAGSKAGRWLSKRWPHFAELTERLKARGLAVASFGTADEYVEGSENRTGGSIEEMSRAMLDCSMFVSNDSGPMHIASALGMPVLALYAPTDPFTHLSLAPNVTALALEKSCAPCEVKDHAYFATGACRCVGEISVAAVEQKVLELLRDASERAGMRAGAGP